MCMDGERVLRLFVNVRMSHAIVIDAQDSLVFYRLLNGPTAISDHNYHLAELFDVFLNDRQSGSRKTVYRSGTGGRSNVAGMRILGTI